MEIKATKARLRVDYRAEGKFYNAGSSEEAPFNNATHSSYPFDSKDLEIGESFEVDGEVVRVVEYKPLQAGQPEIEV